MLFKETELKGSYIIYPDKYEDIRGFFMRTFCKNKFKSHNIDFNIVQTNMSFSHKKGTLRGMHYQDKPYEEAKIVQCIKGSMYDVIIDLREYSQTKDRWTSVELSDKDNTMLYIPKGFANGFQTLEDNTTIIYYNDQYFNHQSSKIILFNDPKYKIKWKFEPTVISEKDKCLSSSVNFNFPNYETYLKNR